MSTFGRGCGSAISALPRGQRRPGARVIAPPKGDMLTHIGAIDAKLVGLFRIYARLDYSPRVAASPWCPRES